MTRRQSRVTTTALVMLCALPVFGSSVATSSLAQPDDGPGWAGAHPQLAEQLESAGRTGDEVEYLVSRDTERDLTGIAADRDAVVATRNQTAADRFEVPSP